MKRIIIILCAILIGLAVNAQDSLAFSAGSYLDSVVIALKKKFPENHTINLVFHGHSVPTGYWSKSEVHTLESYPQLLLKKLKKQYPYAVINNITTSIGGEWAEKGQLRFASEVLPHKPDVLFIDYALNDQGIGLERSEIAWRKMIEEALANHVRVVLLTPSPDQREDILNPENRLVLHAAQIRRLAKEYKIGLVDPLSVFQQIKKEKGSVEKYMSQVNHPNEKGHDIIAGEIFRLFMDGVHL